MYQKLRNYPKNVTLFELYVAIRSLFLAVDRRQARLSGHVSSIRSGTFRRRARTRGSSTGKPLGVYS